MPLRKDIRKVLVIGSGPIVIGQAAEFDYAGTQACLALKEEGITVVLINSNPATIMTDQTIADTVYIEPLNVQVVEEIIKKERPDGIIGTLGGQTGLNLTVQLHEKGILAAYGVELLGTSVESIKNGEDRERFRQLMIDIGEPVPESAIVQCVEDGMRFVEQIGYPVIIRPAYTLGGAGGGFAYNADELESILKKGLSMSPIHQVLVEKSIKGWKEVEYEVMRDANDTCIIVCNMENMDPVGVHTGDSIVVAPSQTLTDVQYQLLRNASLKVIRALEIIGGCNIQFAFDPDSNQYYIIEVNPRVSRSSALASKATGYPIARMAAKCAIGYQLDEIINPITGTTFASFEPALDYIVVKLPRFPFDKFVEADRTLGTQMKATGEVMAIDRTFEGALNKALRSLEMKVSGLYLPSVARRSTDELLQILEVATDIRIFAIAECFRRRIEIATIFQITQIDRWFLEKIKGLIYLEKQLLGYSWDQLPDDLLRKAKMKNMSDAYIAHLFQINEKIVRDKRKALGWKPSYKLVDTCAAEFEAVTPYYYSTWHGFDEAEVSGRKKILVIGSGPIRIGQGIEFDYACVHATLALKKKGYEAIVINNNPETVSTDYSIADRLYFEPLAVEDILHVIEKENVDGVLIQFGGQTAINVANALIEEGINLLGTSMDAIDQLEDRERFYQLLADLEIAHIAGQTVHRAHQLIDAAELLGYPVLVRPSYVIGGQSMFIFYHREELGAYVQQLELENDKRMWPLLVDKYIPGLECEIDVITDGSDLVVPGIFEHIERAGVHSGDSITIFPPISLAYEIKETLIEYAKRIVRALPVVGIMNIQFVISDATVYVLEVNPRASRTVPILSKVTQAPMVEWATYVQLGIPLKELAPSTGLLEEPAYYSVKVPIFSSGKLKEVDPYLGPEMKSTGEVLGLGLSLTEALEKSLFGVMHNPLYKGKEPSYIICSISDRDKGEALECIEVLAQRGFKILATSGTAAFLENKRLSVEILPKDIGKIQQIMKTYPVSAVINMPNQGRVKEKFGFELRQMATRYQITCFTCVDTLKIALSNPRDVCWHVRAMEEYYQTNTLIH